MKDFIKNKYIWLAALLIITELCCKERYNLPQEVAANRYLVVEGFINGGADSTFIRLSRTANPADSAIIQAESGAIVSVEGEDGNSFYLNETEKGKYAAGILPFNNNIKYRVNITTGNGSKYVSDFVSIQRTPQIDSISWNRESNGVQIYANTHDPQNDTRYYSWGFTETWEFHSAYISRWEYRNKKMVLRSYPDSLYTCWQSYTSPNIIIGSTAKLSEDIVYLQPLTFIPQDSWKIGSRYSILVRQRALSKGAYEYFENLRKNSEQLGSIFDPQPSTSIGNIRCVNNPSEIVLGYIYSSTEVEKRIFISRSEVPKWQYVFFCEEISVKNVPDSLEQAFGGGAYLPTDDVRSSVTGIIERYVGSSKSCVDCTLRGTNKRPDFW
ncbi:MAG: DUF4249 domain-containing protein [Sphingobacteriales bacterium]|nr:DUF4249 domain-containing protein [Sphingobacteriales bacterium]OJY84260.1 MAG: hypothetical protein BGP14_18570 [Sphingobacteriales bacterium 44-15]